MPFGSRQAWLVYSELSQREENRFKLKRLVTDLSLNKAMLPYATAHRRSPFSMDGSHVKCERTGAANQLQLL